MTIKWYYRNSNFRLESGTLYSIDYNTDTIYCHCYRNLEKTASDYNENGGVRKLLRDTSPMNLEWLVSNKEFIPEYISKKTVTEILNSLIEEIQHDA